MQNLRQIRYFRARHYCLVLVCLYGQVLSAQQTDTLPGVKVLGRKSADAAGAVMPVQQLNRAELLHLNSISVADAVKYFSGVIVKDYGGIGGLKTISVRSLGANHTGILYDGIPLSDAQGGQVDLGKFSLDNIESITLYNPQPTDLLSPASAYSAGSVLSLRSVTPVFDQSKKITLKAGINAGSFGFAAPSLSISYSVDPHFYNSLSAEYQRADGAYPFQSYTAGSPAMKRENSDISSLRLEYDAGYRINDSNTIKFKVYRYHSKRGLPGAVLLYNSFSDERLNDDDFFTQAGWQRSLGKKSRMLLSGKYSTLSNYYLDPTYPNTQGRLENIFHQQEYYGSGSYTRRFSKIISMAYATDLKISRLQRTDEFAVDFASPTRYAWLNNISALANFESLEFQGSLLGTSQRDDVKFGANGKSINRVSPTLAASFIPSGSSPVRFRIFYKSIFRAPTFNDLYYTYVGNTALRPEFTKQYDAGITWKKTADGYLHNFSLTTDIYYNTVKDKIVAVPRQNLFQWTTLNIGTVNIKGLDAALAFDLGNRGKFKFSSRINYTYQQALDRSDKTSPLYNKQIPYTPMNSGSVNLNAMYNGFSISYNILLSADRYRIGEHIPDNDINGWATQDLSLAYNLTNSRLQQFQFLVQLNNLFNTQYEIIKFYPMPRFNYRAGITAEF